MRGLSLFRKIVFATNILFVILLFLSCLSPYVSTKTLSFLPFLGLTVPALVLLNLLFLGYWLLKRKKQFILSLMALLVGYISLGTFVRFGSGDEEIADDDFTILSYNVREFNKDRNIDSETIYDDIKTFVDDRNPDILCFQESLNLNRMKDYDYPYEYVANKGDEIKTRLSIFSKYPIVNTEIIRFPNSKNNACYADIVIKKDTIRVYNMHMQSLGITPGMGTISSNSPKTLYAKLAAKFKKQEEQAQYIAEHSKDVSYKKIVCGDFNNNQYSRTYYLIKGNKNDSFDEKGSGYGKTFTFHNIPVRIDFILTDPEFEITSHQNFDQKYSDHFPIMASFRLSGD